MSLLCFLCMLLLALAQSRALPDQQLSKKRAHLAVRAIGDELLTAAHDFDTPVQAVQEIDEHTLRLSFKNPIPINPDSLGLLALKHIHSEVAPRAIVNVLEVASGKVVYGFEINHSDQKTIPCLGRNLPASAYYIDISFYKHQPTLLGLNAVTIGMIGFVLVAFALLGIFLFKKRSQNPTHHTILQVKGIKLDLDTNQIVTSDKRIKLTNKETQIIGILFKNEGQLVSRAYLTQEVWLKQGVVTSRSLDMYISRLRKKLKEVSNAEIVNQHGKGYILKV
ncbi:MAG: winged helix-turn-helix domain-containing protein [Bacteroidota bacterium]